MPDLVTRSGLRRLTPIRQPQVLSVVPDRTWSHEEWARIQLGFRGRDMDDRWHIFAEGDRLFLHRSWLGDGKYEVTFAKVDGGCRIIEIKAESGPRSYPGGSDEAKCVLLELLVSSILLGEPAIELHERLRLLRAKGAATPSATTGDANE